MYRTLACLGIVMTCPTSLAGDIETEVISTSCACSIMSLHGTLRSNLVEEQGHDLALANFGRHLVVTVNSFDYDMYGSGSLVGTLNAYALAENVRPIGAVQFLEVDGHRAASVRYKSRYDGYATKSRVVVIDAGNRTVIVNASSKAGRWWDNRDRIQDIIDTLTLSDAISYQRNHSWPITLRDDTLHEARDDYETPTAVPRNHVVLDAAPDGSPYKRVMYSAGPGEMVMYRALSKVQGRRPAVIWVPTALTADPNDNIWSSTHPWTAQPFVDADMVVVVPSFRGMAKNPGEHEFLLGEVDDLLAAIDTVRSLDSVDPDRVYLAGLGYGGTLALLATVAGAPVRATLVYNARPWLFPTMASGGFASQPFPVDDVEAATLRSPIYWTNRLSAPVYAVSDDDSADYALRDMAQLAQASGHFFNIVDAPLSGTMNTVPSVLDVWAEQIGEDTGEMVGIEYTEATLYDAARARYGARARLGR